jgi:hypothetical protein
MDGTRWRRSAYGVEIGLSRLIWPRNRRVVRGFDRSRVPQVRFWFFRSFRTPIMSARHARDSPVLQMTQ